MNDIIVIFQTEALRRLRSRPYLLGTILGAAGLLLIALLPAILDRTFASSGRAVVLAGDPPLVANAAKLMAKDYDVVGTLPSVPAHPTLADLDRRGHAAALVELQRDARGLHVTVYARDVAGVTSALHDDLIPLNVALGTHVAESQIGALLALPIETHSFDARFGDRTSAESAQAAALFLVTILYIAIIINAQNILSSVAEEKTSRIAELLVACVSPSRLLAGKILAAGATATLQIALWGAVVYVLLPPLSHQFGTGAPSSDSPFSAIVTSITALGPGVIAAFVAFFFVGFAEFALLFAGAGSLISRTEDIGSVSGPLIIPVVAGFLTAQAAVNVPNQAQVVMLSQLPLISPFVMFGRIAVSSVPLWQIALSLAINLIAIYAIAVGAGKIYRVGLLTYGRPPKLAQVWAVLRA